MSNDYGPELDKAETDLDLVYQDLHDAQRLIAEMLTALKCADIAFADLGADDTIKLIREAIRKAEEASK